MLKRGKQNAKLGDKITVKMWKGMTIYSLTLEERATCPADCEQWDNCYGDNMPFGHRFDHTAADFIPKLGTHLNQLNNKHPNGFVVRLHVLGDFYSIRYIIQWQLWLSQYENLHVFGYTHHKITTTIGTCINSVNKLHPSKFRIRFSDDYDTEFSAHVGNNTNVIGGIMCPEQVGKTDSCATCGYCWSSKKPVHFIEH
tara:strand:+ start:1623 stop:2216 length:594 start_codon:yes stop_codon:yes gene_type:complete